MRSVALGFWVGTGSRVEDDGQAGLSHLLEHLLFRGSSRYGSLEIDQIFDAHGRRDQRRHGQGDDVVVLAGARRPPRAGDGRDGRHDLAPGPAGGRPRARGRARGDRHVRGRPAGQDLRHPRRGRLRRRPARAGDHRPPRGHPRHAGGRHRARSTALATGPTTSWWRGGLDRPRAAGRARARVAARRRAAGATARPRRAGLPPARALRAQGHRAVPRVPGRAGDRPRRRAPLRPARAGQRSSAARRPRACSRRCGSAAGLAYSVYTFLNHYAGTGQIGLYLGTRADNLAEALRVIGAELERCAKSRPPARSSSASKENVKGRVVLSLESTGARMNRLGSLGAHRRAGARRSTR